jgi:hypothetical protein
VVTARWKIASRTGAIDTPNSFASVLMRNRPPGKMQEWGWRIPFATGGLLAVFAFWLRRNMMESEHSPSAGNESAEPAWSRAAHSP